MPDARAEEAIMDSIAASLDISYSIQHYHTYNSVNYLYVMLISFWCLCPEQNKIYFPR